MHELQPLSPFEQRVVDAARDGEVADFSSADAARNDPLKGDQWGPDRQIRAQLVYALATNSNPSWPVHAKGVRVKGASIVGALDFEAANVKCPLSVERCCIPERIILKHASVSSLDLSGSFVAKGIDADGMRADHDVVLAAGFVANGEVSLMNATLGGDLLCDGGSFVNEVGDALSADGISVGGDVSLGSGFIAKGGVRLPGAQIRGDLECEAASFVNEAGVALNADGIDVKGNIFLRAGFSAKGEVRLLNAKIGSNFECDRSSFVNETGPALYADGIDVKGDIFLGDGFGANGEVRLLGAKIGGDLDCSAGSFENEAGDALSPERIDVKGSLFMMEGFSASGAVDLVGAHVRALVDDEASWPAKLRLDGFTYDAIHGPTGARKRLKWLARQPDGEFRPQPYEIWPACCAGWAMSATREKSHSRSRSRCARAASWAALDGSGAGCCGRPSAMATDSGWFSSGRRCRCCWEPP